MGNDRILVMGVGNPLMSDEGVGPRVVEMLLNGYIFPDGVEVTDAGTMGFSILEMFMGIDQLIIVDAIKESGHPAGTVVILTPEEIAENQIMHSLHDVRISDVLQAAALTGSTPETVCIGVQVENMAEWVMELSPSVEAALPIASAAVIDRLQTLGVEPVAREGVDVNAAIIEALRTYAPMPE